MEERVHSYIWHEVNYEGWSLYSEALPPVKIHGRAAGFDGHSRLGRASALVLEQL